MADITAKDVSKLLDVTASAQDRVIELEKTRAILIGALESVREWFDTWEVHVGPAEQSLFEEMDRAVKYAEDNA